MKNKIKSFQFCIAKSETLNTHLLRCLQVFFLRHLRHPRRHRLRAAGLRAFLLIHLEEGERTEEVKITKRRSNRKEQNSQSNRGISQTPTLSCLDCLLNPYRLQGERTETLL